MLQGVNKKAVLKSNSNSDTSGWDGTERPFSNVWQPTKHN